MSNIRYYWLLFFTIGYLVFPLSCIVVSSKVYDSLISSSSMDKKNKKIPKDRKSDTSSADSSKNKKDSVKTSQELFKKFTSITTDSTTQKKIGILSIYIKEEKYYLALTDSLLNIDFLFVSRIAKGGTGMRAANPWIGYAGDKISSSVLRFVKAPNKKIYLKAMYYDERGGDSVHSDMYRAVAQSNLAPVIEQFPYVGWSKDSSTVLIDITSFFNSDNSTLFFDANDKKSMKIGAFQANKSHIVNAVSFPENAEITTFKTYLSSTESSNRSISMEIATSIIRLPKDPMQARFYDSRVGYFVRNVVDYALNPQGVKSISMITRWRLEPSDSAAYFRGQLVTPKKPIVFYIDPATPEKWIPYFIKGVNWWQKAFETAGFKNAIIGKRAPTKKEDSTWSLSDARFSAIVYKPSPVANASGPHIHDPRTGEILESHINMYHNVMELARNWYVIQCGQSDTTAHHPLLPDTLMGKLLTYIVAHEVGHTLGLRHNWGASHATPTEKLRDKKWVLKNGVSPSIMDYSRFNYVAQVEDHMPQDANMPHHVGPYDKWAIEWGYRLYPEPIGSSPLTERDSLNKRIITQLKNPIYWFGREGHPSDPRSQNEDLGDNAVLASHYGIRNLQYILPRLAQWTKVPNEDYHTLNNLYDALLKQYSNYIRHVSKYIGGIEETPHTVEEDNKVFTPTAKSLQVRALTFLNQELFHTPLWLENKDIKEKLGLNVGHDAIIRLQNHTLESITDASTLENLYAAQREGKEYYTPQDLLTDLKTYLLDEPLKTPEKIDYYTRGLQRTYLNQLIHLASSFTPLSFVKGKLITLGHLTPPSTKDIAGYAKGLLKEIKKLVLSKKGSVSATNKVIRYHLEDLIDIIDAYFNKK